MTTSITLQFPCFSFTVRTLAVCCLSKRQVQWTLEQHRFELHGSASIHVVFSINSPLDPCISPTPADSGQKQYHIVQESTVYNKILRVVTLLTLGSLELTHNWEFIPFDHHLPFTPTPISPWQLPFYSVSLSSTRLHMYVRSEVVLL